MSQSYTWPAISVAAPVGGATAANQVIEIGLLTSIDGKTPTLGQKTMANSSPVVIASDQSALNVLGPLTDTQLRASAVPVSAASLPLPTGAATSALQVTGNASLASIDSKLTAPLSVTGPLTDTQLRASPVPVSGPLTDTQLRATPVPISGTVTANAGTGTFAISAVSLPLPTGAATEATLSSLNGKFNSLGQKTSANSAPVVLASDQSSIPVAATPATTSGSISQAAVTVGTSAVRCTVSGSAPSASRKALIVEPDPTSTAKFYIGSSSVANSGASRGIPLAPGAQFIADFDASDFYIISDTAAQTFFVVEEV